MHALPCAYQPSLYQMYALNISHFYVSIIPPLSWGKIELNKHFAHTQRDTHTHAHAHECSTVPKAYKAVADITGHQGNVKRDHEILLCACFRSQLQDHFLREAFHSLPGRLDLPVMEAHGTGYLSITALDTLAASHVVVRLSGVCPSPPPDFQPHNGMHDVCSAHRVLRA